MYPCGMCGHIEVSDDGEARRDQHRRVSTVESELRLASGAPVGWYYLSFIDPTRPSGDRFIGACWVEGWDVLSAVQRAWAMGCNPGGSPAASGPLPDEMAVLLPAEWTNRLLSRADVDEFDAAMRRIDP